MPNWTSNTITLKGDEKDISEAKAFLENENKVFDFNRVIPMPPSLDMISGSITDEAIVMFVSNKLTEKPDRRKKNWKNCYVYVTNFFSKDWVAEVYKILKNQNMTEEEINKLYDLGSQYVYNYENFGAATWYEWCCKNWGTKWNSAEDFLIDESEDELIYAFETAWSAPFPVIQELSRLFPHLTVTHQFRNEDGYETIYTDILENGCLISETEETDEEYLEELQAWENEESITHHLSSNEL